MFAHEVGGYTGVSGGVRKKTAFVFKILNHALFNYRPRVFLKTLENALWFSLIIYTMQVRMQYLPF